MFDHQVCQALAVKRDDALRQVLHELPRLRAERRRGYEDAFRPYCADVRTVRAN